ncbi:HAMP domain-containing sensor histidine kinase [Caulobacter sp. UNC279MFTsu5.1]|uniref:sensor histidine kinase n=1 Tax=Caulobacter sp. UNC279MFTsu5.1 TaxID=1502775 RepID=UPI0008E76E33|nr:HAMP domain-containing sensor histidine kinase [Caulobacter sp. UNC279MFTsu5.1]SFK16079.1 Signal transduction histidine kinase [Caulobacter sp. UNC279MFTsu5.1]
MRRFSTSLGGRLIAWFIAMQSLLAIVVIALKFVLSPQPGDQYAFAHLNAANLVVRSLEAGPGGAPRIGDTATLRAFRHDRPQVRLAAIHAGQPLAGSSRDLVDALEMQGLPRFASATFAFTRGPLAGSMVVATAERTRWGEVTVVSTGNRFRLADLPALAAQTGGNVLRVMAIVLLGSILIVPLVIRRALEPLERASAQAAQIDLRTRQMRLPEGVGVPSELVSLVRSINMALARLDEGFSRQQRFAAQAAHEMRTPLAILAARVDSQPESELTAALRRDVERMRSLVDQLLFVARLERGDVPLEEPLDLVALARDVVADCTPLALAEGRDLALVPMVTRLPTRGGVAVLESALTNLVRNATRAEPPGGTVEVRVTSAGEIHVIDHGGGVADEDGRRIFEPFWRREHRTPGAGLGLTIVQEAMAAHGGAVKVGRTPGGGATFTMLVPIR